jgi:hypothetical protein
MLLRVAIVVAGLCALAGPTLGHHSGAMFDRTKRVTVSGVIKNYAYTQPHSWIDITVTDASGKAVDWSFEGGTPGQMKTVGITPTTLKTGDKVSITGYPLRDGRPAGAFLQIVMPDGAVIGTRPQPQPAPPAQ